MSQPWRDRRPHFFSLGFPQLLFSLETPAIGVRGVGCSYKSFSRDSEKQTPSALSLAVLSLGLMAACCQGADGHQFPSGSTGATGHITLENPLVGGLIHLILSQCRWTC